jgi:hypothetical protein
MSASKKSGQLTCYQTGQFYLLPTDIKEFLNESHKRRAGFLGHGGSLFSGGCRRHPTG